MDAKPTTKSAIYLIYPDRTFGGSVLFRRALNRLFVNTPATLTVLRNLTPSKYSVRITDERTSAIDYDFRGLVGLTSMTYNARNAYQIADRFRHKGNRVVMGGIHVSFCPDEALQHCDAVVIGEAESIWRQVLKDYRADKLQRSYHGERLSDFAGHMADSAARIPPKDLYAAIQTTRGCNSRGTFCSVHAYNGEARNLPLDTAVRLIEKIPWPYRKYLLLLDDNIYANPQYFKQLFSRLARLNIRWSALCSLEVAKDDEALALLKASGCKTLAIGFESTNRQTLQALGKPYDPAQYEHLISRLHSIGIRVVGFFIIGADTDTRETVLQTLRFCQRVNIAWPHFLILTPLPGTEVFRALTEQNRIVVDDWNQYDLDHVVFEPQNFSRKELKELQTWCNKRLHCRRALAGFLFRSLRRGRRQNVVPILVRLCKYFFRRWK